jgi:hypothetical protein
MTEPLKRRSQALVVASRWLAPLLGAVIVVGLGLSALSFLSMAGSSDRGTNLQAVDEVSCAITGVLGVVTAYGIYLSYVRPLVGRRTVLATSIIAGVWFLAYFVLQARSSGFTWDGLSVLSLYAGVACAITTWLAGAGYFLFDRVRATSGDEGVLTDQQETLP